MREGGAPSSCLRLVFESKPRGRGKPAPTMGVGVVGTIRLAEIEDVVARRLRGTVLGVGDVDGVADAGVKVRGCVSSADRCIQEIAAFADAIAAAGRMW